MEALLIQGGRVIDPAGGFDETADVLVADGKVAEISTSPIPAGALPGVRIINAEGCLVTPGLIDLHVHFRDPGPDHPETIATGSASAVAGGFTTVCCMPNTTPPLDEPGAITAAGRRAAEAGGARVFVVGCVTRGRRGEVVADIAAMAAAGAVAFSDDGDCVASAGVMRDALRAVKAAGGCFMQHCEEPTLTRGAVMNAGAVAEGLGLTGWPAMAEEIIIERDGRLNRDVGARYHAQHVSSAASCALIRRFRAEGQPVSGEASPHHLLLTEDACAGGDPNTKMNPPLRTGADVDGLKAAVADGSITILATDHAPHPAAAKDVGFRDAAFGIVGLDCALPLYARALIEDGVLSWPAMLAMMTINPARLVGLDAKGLGRLAVGGPADVTVIDPDQPWTIRAAEFATTGRNCPFEGWSVRGRAIATVVGGAVRRLVGGDRVRS